MYTYPVRVWSLIICSIFKPSTWLVLPSCLLRFWIRIFSFLETACRLLVVSKIVWNCHLLFYRSYQQFDTFTRQLFATCPYSVIFPCSVFETMFDPSNGELVRFQEKSADIPRSIPSQHYTVSSEVRIYLFPFLTRFTMVSVQIYFLMGLPMPLPIPMPSNAIQCHLIPMPSSTFILRNSAIAKIGCVPGCSGNWLPWHSLGNWPVPLQVAPRYGKDQQSEWTPHILTGIEAQPELGIQRLAGRNVINLAAFY